MPGDKIRDGDDSRAPCHDGVVKLLQAAAAVIGPVICRYEMSARTSRGIQCTPGRRPRSRVHDVDVVVIDERRQFAGIAMHDEWIFGIQRQRDMA